MMLKPLAATLALLTAPLAAQADQFQCDAMGDGSYTIIMSAFHEGVAWAIYRLEGDMAFMAGEEAGGITLMRIEEGDDIYYDAPESGVQFWPVESFGRLFADGEDVDCYPAPPGGL